MPLPEQSTPWPPRSVARVHERMRTWDAWYSGDPDALAAMYGANPGANPRDPASPFDQYGMLIDRGFAGRIRGRLRRWFWGTPTPQGEREHKLHIPIAGDIAATSADLLFGEMPKATVTNTKTQDRLSELIEAGVHPALLEGAELAAAMGGVFLRVAWDQEVAEHPWIVAAHADAAIPEWTWGKLSAVTFWEVLEGPGTPGARTSTVLRHLERHERGVILHGLYEGTAEQLGRPIPLAEHAATQALAGIVDERSAVPTGLTKLTVNYVPNMRPNRVWRSDPAAVNLGRSDYAGVEGPMDALDETWTSWMRDIRLGKARLLVPDIYLQNLGPGRGAYFDAERELYTGLSMLPKPDGSSGSMITENQFKIRVAEHSQTANELIAIIIRDAGYSAVTFGELTDASNAATATEVNARERKTLTTLSRKIGYWRPELADLLETLLQVDANLTGGGITPERPKLEWPDAVAPSRADTATAIQILHAAEVLSRETGVRMAHPDWDDTQVGEELARLRQEFPPLADPTKVPGAGDVQPPRYEF